MIWNYLNTALRALSKSRFHAAINIGGLAIGFAAALLIALFVREETSYDKWLADHGRIFTMETGFTIPGRAPKSLATTPIEVRGALEKDYAELEAVTRLRAGAATLMFENKSFTEDVFIVEPNFFRVIALDFARGDAETALAENNSLVITQRLAEKYFGDQDALGRAITFADQDFTVRAVVRNLPGKSHLKFDALFYFNPQQMVLDNVDWSSMRVYSYLKLAPGARISDIEQDLEGFVARNAVFSPDSLKAYQPTELLSFRMVPFADVHLKATGQSPIRPGGNINLVYGFMGIAALIIFIACINFINLSTAAAGGRASEVAIRKVMGAGRGQLAVQHIGESLLTMALAIFVALALAELAGPVFFSQVGMDNLADVEFGLPFIAVMAAGGLVIGLIASIYPAFFLSKIRPALALSGGRAASPKTVRLRSILVLTQFVVSIALMVTAEHFYLQTRYAISMDPGFDKENLIVYRGAGANGLAGVRQTLKVEMGKVPGVDAVTFTSKSPSDEFENNVTLTPAGAEAGADTLVAAISVDPDFFNAYGIPILAGRGLDFDRAGDLLRDPEDPDTVPEVNIVINATAVRALGFVDREAAIGASFRMNDYLSGSGTALATVVGVSNDSHFRSIHQLVPPSLYVQYPLYYSDMAVKATGGDLARTARALDGVWQSLLPERAAAREFLDETFDAQYANDVRQTQVFAAFAFLAVIIACLGVLGLAAYSVEKRTKEVGVRKVLGAGAKDIVRLFLWQFSKPVLLANVIAWPLAWLALHNWLQGFAYRIDQSPLLFLAAGAATLIVAWLVVGGHTLRVARANPIDALRCE